jgi:hypothetical protein
MVKNKGRQLREGEGIPGASIPEGLARALDKMITNPTPPMRRPEKKATNPGPGSRKEPKWHRQARKHMNNPKIVQSNPSYFRVTIDFQCSLFYKPLFFKKGF